MTDKSENKEKRVGRPRIPDSRKVLYQRIPVEYVTYKKLLEIKKQSTSRVTFTEIIEALLQANNIK